MELRVDKAVGVDELVLQCASGLRRTIAGFHIDKLIITEYFIATQVGEKAFRSRREGRS
jgi:hypothetical protein